MTTMKKRVLLCACCVGLSTGVYGHDTDHPVEGELRSFHAHEHTALDLVIGKARALADIQIEGAWRLISGNGYPDSKPGAFPNKGNPHSIQKKDYQVRVPAQPGQPGRVTMMGSRDVFGISVDGVLFEGLTAEFWKNDRSSGWNYYAHYKGCSLGLDHNNAHVQPNGTYHYHGVPNGIVNARGGSQTPTLVGYAADGFPIYGDLGYQDATNTQNGVKEIKSSYQLKSGTRPTGPGGRYSGAFVEDYEYQAGSGDLDECNGRTGVTPEYPEGIYHYVVTKDFPTVPLCWRGTPDRSLAKVNMANTKGAMNMHQGGNHPPRGMQNGMRPGPRHGGPGGPGGGPRQHGVRGGNDPFAGGARRGGPCSGS